MSSDRSRKYELVQPATASGDATLLTRFRWMNLGLGIVYLSVAIVFTVVLHNADTVQYQGCIPVSRGGVHYYERYSIMCSPRGQLSLTAAVVIPLYLMGIMRFVNLSMGKYYLVLLRRNLINLWLEYAVFVGLFAVATQSLVGLIQSWMAIQTACGAIALMVLCSIPLSENKGAHILALLATVLSICAGPVVVQTWTRDKTYMPPVLTCALTNMVIAVVAYPVIHIVSEWLIVSLERRAVILEVTTLVMSIILSAVITKVTHLG